MWRDEVLKRCSKNQHPSSSRVVGAGGAWVSAPPVPWCRALVATGIVRHQWFSIRIKCIKTLSPMVKMNISKFFYYYGRRRLACKLQYIGIFHPLSEKNSHSVSLSSPLCLGSLSCLLVRWASKQPLFGTLHLLISYGYLVVSMGLLQL